MSILGSLSVHISLEFTVPFGRPSASVEFLPSLTLPHYDYCISLGPCPKHNTRIRSLSMLVLSNSETRNLNGYMGWCGCHDILIALCYSQIRSLLPRSKKVSTRPQFSIWMRRETLRYDSQSWVGDTEKFLLMRKNDVVPRNVHPLLGNWHFLVEFHWFLINCIQNLSTSLFSCAKTEFSCSSFVVQNWEIPR